jgi:alpha-methylacyl-CoA racemase
MSGPLSGVRIIELRAIGPVPFAGMMLSDLGADVIRIDRPPSATAPTGPEPGERNRRSIALDLKQPAGRDALLRICADADALIEGYRPGVAERLGVGPDDCHARNPRLVYGRMTGWGQDGPLAHAAGHDINYIALAGALHAFGRRGEAPVPPLNLVGDYGGGGMLLAFGVVCALYEARSSGLGQVVDAAMVDGAALLTTRFHELLAAGEWQDERGVNELDTGAPYYDVYETSDGRHVAIGALESQFYADLIGRLGLDLPRETTAPHELRSAFTTLFRSRTQREWCDLLQGTDACFAPVLSLTEAPAHPHNVARGTFVDVGGVIQPAPAPRFSRTPGSVRRPAVAAGADTDETLAELGFTSDEVEALRLSGAAH